jgi:hypothetical protein
VLTIDFRSFRIASALMVWGLVVGCASRQSVARAAVQPATVPCQLASAAPWITRWLEAWDLTSRQILHLRDATSPNFVFYDNTCVYTTSKVTGAAVAGRGATVSGTAHAWWVVQHAGRITLPNGEAVPVQLMSFTSSAAESGPFIVMAAPAYWAQAGHGQEPGLTAVFVHELTHTQQLPGMAAIIGAIDSAWTFPEELDDDVVQKRFGADSAYVSAYLAERDLLYRAAAADSVTEVRALAAQALVLIRARHGRWLTGENAVFATLDATWLSMEGSAQWAAYAWLAHPAGGGLDRAAAVKGMIGQRRSWVQDEGLALFLVVDRLLPEWPSLVFRTPSIGAVDLLERAVHW